MAKSDRANNWAVTALTVQLTLIFGAYAMDNRQFAVVYAARKWLNLRRIIVFIRRETFNADVIFQVVKPDPRNSQQMNHFATRVVLRQRSLRVMVVCFNGTWWLNVDRRQVDVRLHRRRNIWPRRTTTLSSVAGHNVGQSGTEMFSARPVTGMAKFR